MNIHQEQQVAHEDIDDDDKRINIEGMLMFTTLSRWEIIFPLPGALDLPLKGYSHDSEYDGLM